MNQSSTISVALRWLASTRVISPQAAAATLSLIVIQVGIGIIMKYAQTSGSYSFSPSASVAISEFFKLVLSSLFFQRERAAAWRQRLAMATGSTPCQTLFANDSGVKDDKETAHTDSEPMLPSPSPELGNPTFWGDFCKMVSREKIASFYVLATCYTLINNTIFIGYSMADPGTIQLVKSSNTFVTALIMVLSLNTAISKIQWVAIVVQVLGLGLTQYKPENGTTYSAGTYAVLLLQVALGASAGVYNQYLMKLDDAHLHIDNMMLYASGTVINLLCHLVIRAISADEPGFFQGYGSISAVLVILSNVFIGLALTAVYKYADAILKCLATAVSTGLLLFLSPILFGAELGDLVLIGTIIVLASSWLYLSNPPVKQPDRVGTPSDDAPRWRLGHMPRSIFSRSPMAVLGVVTMVTLIVVPFLTVEKDALSGTLIPHKSIPTDNEITSPFNNSVAMIRWNSARKERVPLLRKYESFFHSLHISMPEMMPEHPVDFRNWTVDQSPATFTIYTEVAHMMQLILEKQPDLDGLIYFHFDAWIDPFGWRDMDRTNIWFPMASEEHGGPLFKCMSDVSKYPWWGWGNGFHDQAIRAERVIDQLNLGYKVYLDEWCLGWSDIYYIPRRFFSDFIILADIFTGYNVFHEVAIPTILRIISDTRSHSPKKPVMDIIRDCWGSCCASGPSVENVTTTRCGHRLDYTNDTVTQAFYAKLQNESSILTRGQDLLSTINSKTNISTIEK